MTILEAVKTYLLTYPSLETGALLLVNHLGPDPVGYTIVPLPGEKVLEWYVDGGSSRAYYFAFQSVESTADELERLENCGFFEDLSTWFETQSNAGTLPSLGSGKTATWIEATGFGYLFEQGQSETGIYQIQCRLTYEQQP